MASRYTQIGAKQFSDTMTVMGFEEIPLHGTMELVYQCIVDRGPQPDRFAVRIFSSVSRLLGVTRECGEDAIRVMLIDLRTDKMVSSISVHRTQNALLNMRKRAREVYRIALDPRTMCPKCGSILTERRRKTDGQSFLGCTHYPRCQHTAPIAIAA